MIVSTPNRRFVVELEDGLTAGAFGLRTGGAGSFDGEGDRKLLPLALPLAGAQLSSHGALGLEPKSLSAQVHRSAKAVGS